MTYLRTVDGPQTVDEARKSLPFDPEPTEGLAEVTRLEIWATMWDDGEDFTEFRVCAGKG